jgi:hypothetical protein
MAPRMSPSLDVRRSAIEGRGVFAGQAISAGTLIHRMGGRRISLAACALGIAAGKLRFDDPLQIGRWHFIDLDAVSVCFNSSCEPNAGLRGEADLIALRDISLGEEITFDYALTVLPAPWNRRWRMACTCGAPTCRGVIGNLDTIPADALRRYADAGCGQDYVQRCIRRRLRAEPGAGM